MPSPAGPARLTLFHVRRLKQQPSLKCHAISANSYADEQADLASQTARGAHKGSGDDASNEWHNCFSRGTAGRAVFSGYVARGFLRAVLVQPDGSFRFPNERFRPHTGACRGTRAFAGD